jgi:ketosteroid isomerase-like protein
MTALGEIDDDIWHPFRCAYETLDLDAFVGLHDPALVRVEAGARWIGDRDAYAERTAAGFARARTDGDTFTIEFRFEDRLAGADAASDRGVYRLTITHADTSQLVFHGRFSTIHRRTPDGWRIVVDHDDTVADGPAAFAAGAALGDHARFGDP